MYMRYVTALFKSSFGHPATLLCSFVSIVDTAKPAFLAASVTMSWLTPCLGMWQSHSELLAFFERSEKAVAKNSFGSSSLYNTSPATMVSKIVDWYLFSDVLYASTNHSENFVRPVDPSSVSCQSKRVACTTDVFIWLFGFSKFDRNKLIAFGSPSVNTIAVGLYFGMHIFEIAMPRTPVPLPSSRTLRW